MEYDKELIAHKLQRWDKFITDYHLPDWETIPDFGLYMDQVIVLLEQYLSFIPAPVGGKERFVTSSTINNYVRLKIMPAPEKRKYHRIHIAYLIMILTMKQSLSISDVQKILPADSNETDVRAVYEDYSLKFRRVGLFFNQQVQSGSEGIRSRGAAGHRKCADRRVFQDIGGEADTPVRRRCRGCAGRGADTAPAVINRAIV